MVQGACRTIAEGLDHPEGVAWSDDYGLFAGGELGQIYRIDMADGSVEEIARSGGFALGMAFGPEEKLFVCDMGLGQVISVDMMTGAIEHWSEDLGLSLNVPNFLAYAPDGTLFISDSGHWEDRSGRVIRVGTDGAHSVVAEGGAFTNGLAVGLDGKALYAVESSLGRILRYEIQGESLGEAREVAAFHRVVPDGLAFAQSGDLVVSCYRPDALFRVSPDGTASELVNDWTGLALAAPTNVVFAGRDRRTLISANLGSNHLTAISCELTGIKLPFTYAGAETDQ